MKAAVAIVFVAVVGAWLVTRVWDSPKLRRVRAERALRKGRRDA